MGSVSRRIARSDGFHVPGYGSPAQKLELLLFGSYPAPNDECKAERERIVERFVRCRSGFQARSDGTLLAYLRERRDDYEPKRDGMSQWMALLDDIDALSEEESVVLRG